MAGWGLFDFFDSDRIPFYARYPVPAAFTFPADFSTSNYAGLTVCHLLPAPPDQHLVSYWRDEQSYRAYEGPFRAALALPAPRQFGVVTGIKREKDVWWKPKSLSAAVLAVAATFGGLTAIRDYFAVLFALSDVTLTYGDASHVDAVEGDQVAIPVTALSGVRFTQETVLFDAPVLQPNPGNTKPWTFDATTIPSLSAAQPQKVTVMGTAPPHSGKQGGPDIYHLNLSSSAKAGVLTGVVLKGRATAPDKELWIWSTKPGLSRPKTGRTYGTSCEFLGDLDSPRAYAQGLSIEVVVVARRGEVSALNVSAQGGISAAEEISSDGTAFVAGVHWPALEKFRTYSYRIFLEGAKPADRSLCEQWIDKMRVAVR
jgi:hypothetical protein